MKVLLTGATGRLGPHITSALRGHGMHVTAVTRDPERAAAVLGPDVDTVTGDLSEPSTLTGPLAAADTLVLLTPHGPEMAAMQIALVDAARAAGTRVVKISGTSSGIRSDGPDACRQHWQVEEHLRGSGIPFVVVRPNAFMQTLLAGVAATVRTRAVVVNPLGDAGISLVDCADIGAATAHVVTDPSCDGNTYVLTGPAAPTYRQLAADVEQATGRAVRVEDIEPAEAAARARVNGLSAWEAEHLGAMLAMFATGASEYVTDDVEKLTGRPPTTARAWVESQLGLFTA